MIRKSIAGILVLLSLTGCVVGRVCVKGDGCAIDLSAQKNDAGETEVSVGVQSDDITISVDGAKN